MAGRADSEVADCSVIGGAIDGSVRGIRLSVATIAQLRVTSIDANFANLLQGVILFIVLAADFFTRFKLVRRGGKEAVK